MADTSTFMPIGEVPMIDYGAVYRNAKARRELEEEKKLAYLNQFQQERGANVKTTGQELPSSSEIHISQEITGNKCSYRAGDNR